MKYLLPLFCFFSLGCTDNHQPSSTAKPNIQFRDSALKNERNNPYAPVDVSPMDMVYLPSDFPVLKMTKKETGQPVARVIYSRPHRQGRTIFGGLLKYGEPWRLGANEATEIELFQPVTIQNKKVNKGRYVLYCIPQEHEWTVVFNSNLYTWGLTPDPSKDLFKFVIPVSKAPVTLEYFTIAFDDGNKTDSADLIMGWENVVGRLPVYYQ